MDEQYTHYVVRATSGVDFDATFRLLARDEDQAEREGWRRVAKILGGGNWWKGLVEIEVRALPTCEACGQLVGPSF